MYLKTITAALLLAASALPAAATARIYCAASDPAAKMSIESAFAARDGKRLVHFRGIVDLMSDKAPDAFASLKLNSGMLRQSWMDGDELRLRIYTDNRDARPFQTFELSIATHASADNRDRFTGRYTLTVESADEKRAAPRDIILSHEAAIFCEVK
ncbi:MULTISPECIES: hypothetical protein [Alphaproteobacteria]|uniref:Uncharacterized protein n=2 Tax=Alphaproteobacteria TaxID=28211 RepID=A0A512HI56_9HYPH|nr:MULTISPECIES: hypothetical protein [Alphaproteobacteria]GEO85136.1 hypothetical protein RNA01_20680 [Ciceribacter naphthalenivorans]GLR24530.1 hypothetical protein GCM10007920_43240 [Ciceribacter naphthalenivorans]GLT07386.1 hypothetical protein GCM10007926_43240 [Sphingomonas psychrolutea]